MTPLTPILLAQIAREGPMTLADYMTTCLHHPQHGYYSTRDPLGAHGDFTTAPEISQMFGELVGLSLAQAWQDQGAPADAVLAELGPGRGTLMADILRATRAVPGFHNSLRLCLIETSPALRAEQRRRLAGHDPQFFASVADLPPGPLFLVANEFFDALPIRAFQRSPAGWDEWRVGATEDRLVLGRHPMGEIAALAGAFATSKPGDVVELCPAGEAISTEIGRRIADQGGTALIIDYGATDRREPSFQAVRRHRKVDPLAHPGDSDLTAHVSFDALLRASTPARGFGPTEQGRFLERLGLSQRADVLARNLAGDALTAHRAAQRRLTDSAEMGSLFKVIGMVPDGMPPPPGLNA